MNKYPFLHTIQIPVKRRIFRPHYEVLWMVWSNTSKKHLNIMKLGLKKQNCHSPDYQSHPVRHYQDQKNIPVDSLSTMKIHRTTTILLTRGIACWRNKPSAIKVRSIIHKRMFINPNIDSAFLSWTSVSSYTYIFIMNIPHPHLEPCYQHIKCLLTLQLHSYLHLKILTCFI